MSEMNTAEAIDNTIFDAIKDFIDTRKKKKSPSKADGKLFSDLWTQCVAELGVNEKTMSLLCDGFRYSNARPLHSFCIGEESKAFPYSMIRTYRCVRDGNGDIELRLYISLFALELIEPTEEDQLSWLMKAIPQAAINKEGKINGNLKTYLRKLLLEEIERCPLPPKREQEGAASKESLRFARFLSTELRSMTDELKTPSLQGAARSLIEWLGISESGENREEQNGKQPSVDMTCAKNPNEEPASPTRTEESSSDNDETNDRLAKEVECEDVIAFIRRQQKSLEAAKNSLSALEVSATRFRKERDELRLQVGELESKVEIARDRASSLERELLDWKKAYEDAAAEAAAKEELLALGQKTKAKQADEATKRIAKKLAIEYRDYQDAVGLDMDADLGENMRLQLGSVFEILIDAGFEL